MSMWLTICIPTGRMKGNKVITRKTLLTELARRDIRTLQQLPAMTVDDLQSVPGIGYARPVSRAA